GTWELKNGEFSAHVDDAPTEKSTRGSSGWEVTSRTFKIDHSDEAEFTTHQFDDGLGEPAPEPGTVEQRSHELHTSVEIKNKTFMEGTPDAFTFKLKRYDWRWRDESQSWDVTTAATGETHKFKKTTLNYRLIDDSHQGTSTKRVDKELVANETNFSVHHVERDESNVDTSNDSPTNYTEFHQHTLRLYYGDQSGKTGDRTGDQTWVTQDNMWWKQVDKKALFGSSTGGNPNDGPV